MCDLVTSRMRRPWPALGRNDTRKKEKKRKGNTSLSEFTCIHISVSIFTQLHHFQPLLTHFWQSAFTSVLLETLPHTSQRASSSLHSQRRLKISQHATVILRDFCGFSQTLQTNVDTALKILLKPHFPQTFPLINRPNIQS